MIYDIKYFDSVTSTNDIAKEMASGGAPEGTVVIANSQSNGRGRMGRSFFSPSMTGIYISIILRPTLSAGDSLLITTAAAAAVCAAAESFAKKECRIKWVNDIYLDEKKICGILTEGKFAPDGSLEYAVLGIGINLEVPCGGFGELESIAGALFCHGEKYDKSALVKKVLDGFSDYYSKLADKPHFEYYISHDMLIGKEVDILRSGKNVGSAKVIGISDDFSLIVENNGKKELLQNGEVSIKVKRL